MLLFEWIIFLLLAAVVLSAVAGRLAVPWPAFLALGGAAVAFLPHAPAITLDPHLALALFVAPVLLDAAYDTSLRDLKDNWVPVGALVVIAVGVTTAAVAVVAHALVPGMPWAATVALGAIVAPPDAAAATAVLRQVRLPHRLLVILEGESLLNDASALLVYRLAVGAVTAGGFSAARVLPLFAVVVVGSAFVGAACAWAWVRLVPRLRDVPSSIVLQFVGTFVVWIGAERVGLSGILTVVVYGIALARQTPDWLPARLRVSSYAVWETFVFVSNVLAFLLIGLQMRPVFAPLSPHERWRYVGVAAAVLATAIVARVVWVLVYNTAVRWKHRRWGFNPVRPMLRPTVQTGIVLSWCGMRGIVTLAAALALPDGRHGGVAFPHRDVILVCAFGVVLGTLVIQGFTIGPLLRRLSLRADDTVEREVNTGRCHAFSAALDALDGDQSPTAVALRNEYSDALRRAEQDGHVPEHLAGDLLRRRTVAAARRAIVGLRSDGRIGDAAFHRLEEDLDRLELSVGEG